LVLSNRSIPGEATVNQQATHRTRRTVGWAPFLDWIVLGRAIGQGLLKGLIFGAIAGLPFALLGAIPGAVVGATAGLASAIAPGIMLAATADKWRQDLVRPESLAAVLAAAPWMAAAINYSTRKPAVPLGLLGCAMVAGVTVALLTRRILNGAA
jgi:hypothetical protein